MSQPYKINCPLNINNHDTINAMDHFSVIDHSAQKGFSVSHFPNEKNEQIDEQVGIQQDMWNLKFEAKKDFDTQEVDQFNETKSISSRKEGFSLLFESKVSSSVNYEEQIKEQIHQEQFLKDQPFKDKNPASLSSSQHTIQYLNFFQQFRFQHPFTNLNPSLKPAQNLIQIPTKSQLQSQLLSNGIYVQQPNSTKHYTSYFYTQQFFVQSQYRVLQQNQLLDWFHEYTKHADCLCQTHTKLLLKNCQSQKNSHDQKTCGKQDQNKQLFSTDSIFYQNTSKDKSQEQIYQGVCQPSLAPEVSQIKIVEIRSTMSPQCLEIICCLSSTYYFRIFLIINYRTSQIHQQTLFSEGSYGKIYLMKSPNFNSSEEQIRPQTEYDSMLKKYFVVKCFEKKQDQLFRDLFLIVLRQYCVALIMSSLQIGPKIVRKFGFDLMIHQNCIEYCMEYCRTHQIYDEQTTIPQLKTALLTIHQLQLVHLDIKPENLAYSPYFKKNVFIDFGFSQIINESLGQRTITPYIGTYEYSSPQMKKTLTSDSFVDLYYNDMYSLEKSILFFKQFYNRNIYNQYFAHSSSLSYQYTLNNFINVEIHHQQIKEFLILIQLKFWLINQNHLISPFLIEILTKFDDKNGMIKIKDSNQKDKKINLKNVEGQQKISFVGAYQNESQSSEVSLRNIAQELADKNNQQKQLLFIEQDQRQGKYFQSNIIRRDQINDISPFAPINLNNNYKPNKMCKKVKGQLIQFFKNLTMNAFYGDIYYEYIIYLFQNEEQQLEIQTKIKSHGIYNCIKCISKNQEYDFLLNKIKNQIFSHQYKIQQNYLFQDQQEWTPKNVLNSDQTLKLEQKKFQFEENQILFKKQRSLVNLKQKLLDKYFLRTISMEEHFHLYYRFVTFKNNLYKAKLNQKIEVSKFFITFRKIDVAKYHDFKDFFVQIIKSSEKQTSSAQSLSKQKSIIQNLFQLQSKCIDDKQSQNNISQSQYKQQILESPFYQIIICFRYMIVKCIYIDPSKVQLKQLFVALISEYFLIDNAIFTPENDFNYLAPWYRVIRWHNLYFQTNIEKLTYFRRISKNQDELQFFIKRFSNKRNLLELIQQLWRIKYSFKKLRYRLKPLNLMQKNDVQFIEEIDFILNNDKLIIQQFTSSQLIIKLFRKMIKIDSMLSQYSGQNAEQYLTLGEIKLIKDQIIKNTQIQDRTKKNLLKRFTYFIYCHDVIIQTFINRAKIIERQVSFINFYQKNMELNQKQNSINDLNLIDQNISSRLLSNSTQSSKNIVFEVINASINYDQIQEIHYEIVEKLFKNGNTSQARAIIHQIEKHIDCEQISKNFFVIHKICHLYYFKANCFSAIDYYVRNVEIFNPYIVFDSQKWILSLMSFSNDFMNQQSRALFMILASHQKYQNSFQFKKSQFHLNYEKFVTFNQKLYTKLKIYIRTLVNEIKYGKKNLKEQIFKIFFETIKDILYYLRVQPTISQNLEKFIYKISPEKSDVKKSYFYQIFDHVLPIYNQIQKTKSLIQSNSRIQQRSFQQQFNLIKIQMKSLQLFQQKKYLECLEFIYNNSSHLTFNKNIFERNIYLDLNELLYKVMTIYVKSFFLIYIYGNTCWIKRFDLTLYPYFSSLYDEQNLVKISSDEQNFPSKQSQAHKKLYNQYLQILYLYYMMTGNFVNCFAMNAPTIQLLIEKSKKINDQASYLTMIMYLLIVSRYLACNRSFRYFQAFIAIFKEFSQKSFLPIVTKFFDYVINFNNIIFSEKSNKFQQEIKQWKNPYWWIIMNYALKYSSISNQIVKRIIIKIVLSLSHVKKQVRQEVIPSFLINLLRYNDYMCKKGKISTIQLQKHIKIFNKFQSKINNYKYPFQILLIFQFKHILQISSIIFQKIKTQYIEPEVLQRQKQKIIVIQKPQCWDFYCINLFQKKQHEKQLLEYLQNISSLSSSIIKVQDSSSLYFPNKSSSKFQQKKQQSRFYQKFRHSDYFGNYKNPQFIQKIEQINYFFHIKQELVSSNERHLITQSKIIHKLLRKIFTKHKNQQNLDEEHKVQKMYFAAKK